MMMTRPDPTPTPPEIARAPECAALSILDNNLYTAAFALLAVNPRVADVDFEPSRFDRREILAEAIINHAAVMQSLLRRYRQAAAEWPQSRQVHDPF